MEEEAQGIAGWTGELVLFRLFPTPAGSAPAMTPVRIAQLGLYDLAERIGFKLLPGRLGQMATLVNPPVLRDRSCPRSCRRSAGGARVAFFVGCVADAMFRHTHWATLRVLQQNGCDILIPDGQGTAGRSTTAPAPPPGGCRRQRGRLRPGRSTR